MFERTTVPDAFRVFIRGR